MSTSKSAKAVVAAGKLDKIILERYLTNTIPKSNQLCLKQVNKYTGFEYYGLRYYMHSALYTISKDTINITDDIGLLSTKSKEYVQHIIKNAVFPSKYENDEFIYCIGKFLDSSYFTDEEQNFIELMTNELLLIINSKDLTSSLSLKDLMKFHFLNRSSFRITARRVYNDIIQKKIHVGDNIIEYLKTYLSEIDVAEKLEKSCKYDYFFDNNGILKCDLDTNRDILIKNFLNTILYDLTDDKAIIILLRKLNCKYPFLINERK